MATRHAICHVIVFMQTFIELVLYKYIYRTMDWKVVSSNPTSGMPGDFSQPAPTLGEFAGSMGRLVPPGQVSSTLRMQKRGTLGSMTLAIWDD